MPRQSLGELYPRELEHAFQLCRIAEASRRDRNGDNSSSRYFVDCKVHEPIGSDNQIRIKDFDDDAVISVAELEDRMGEDLLSRFFYKRSVRSA